MVYWRVLWEKRRRYILLGFAEVSAGKVLVLSEY